MKPHGTMYMFSLHHSAHTHIYDSYGSSEQILSVFFACYVSDEMIFLENSLLFCVADVFMYKLYSSVILWKLAYPLQTLHDIEFDTPLPPNIVC